MEHIGVKLSIPNEGTAVVATGEYASTEWTIVEKNGVGT